MPHAEGLFIAGDWVGPVGLLADAAAASGRSAGEAAAAFARADGGVGLVLARETGGVGRSTTDPIF